MQLFEGKKNQIFRADALYPVVIHARGNPDKFCTFLLVLVQMLKIVKIKTNMVIRLAPADY